MTKIQFKLQFNENSIYNIHNKSRSYQKNVWRQTTCGDIFILQFNENSIYNIHNKSRSYQKNVWRQTTCGYIFVLLKFHSKPKSKCSAEVSLN